MNQYKTWVYVLIAVILGIGALYASPNLYGTQPAVLITEEKGRQLPADFNLRIESLLREANVAHNGVEGNTQRMMAYFPDNESQAKAREALEEALKAEGYISALNTAPATPDWLRGLGASPMVLGLDLQGGIHFLMQVDMEAAGEQMITRMREDIIETLRSQGVDYKSVKREVNDLVVVFDSEEERAEGLRELNRIEEIRNLGLDTESDGDDLLLRGAITDITLQEIRAQAVQQNMTVLRTRVNSLGVAEPLIQQQGADRIVVQLPGVQDSTTAKQILGRTATLEYRAVDEKNSALVAANTGRIPADSRLYFDRNGQPFLLKKRLIVSGNQVVGATAGFDQQTGSAAVSVKLDGPGSKRMLDFTKQNVGKPMGVVFIETKPEGGKVEQIISVANIREPFGKQFQTTGLDGSKEAADLALMLRAGALSAPMRIIEERGIGPSLGADNIAQGFQSVMIGFAFVLVFMLIYYRFFGIFANTALAVNLIMIVAVLSILGATLTLPGIAGIVLTVGMAVDANVLIFERIREELRNGVTPQASIRAGYDKAFSTIADANITTFIAALVLGVFGTGPIRGFAVTLSIGILTSMFTAIILTRALVNLTYGRKQRVKALSI